MKRKLFSIIAATAVAVLETTTGQPAAVTTPPASTATANSPDQQWESLKNYGRLPATPSGKQPRAPTVSRAAEAAVFVGQANQLRTFYAQYPAHSAAKEAKRLETLALSQAEINGDASEDARRSLLLGEIRKDASVPEAKRYEAVAWDRQATASRQVQTTHAARMAAQK